ncbi:MAG: stage II sporulation protein R [Firmicutes bacterium]|nr:stage II sporulation protein R [Bacillota bacterium]
MLRRLRLAVGFTALTVALFLFYQVYVPVRATSAEGYDLIRLHILAHSNHPRDQALKLEVRDAVIKETAALFAACTTEQEAEQALLEHLGLVEAVVNRVLIQAGVSYRGQVEVGTYPFSRRTYGDMTLPAGCYRALRIVLGDGQGHNWWCVLFPPLCFVSGSSGHITPPGDVSLDSMIETKRVLAASKSGAEKSTGSNPDGNGDELEIRFKVAEIWEKVRPQVLISWQQEESILFNSVLNMISP